MLKLTRLFSPCEPRTREPTLEPMDLCKIDGHWAILYKNVEEPQKGNGKYHDKEHSKTNERGNKQVQVK